MGIHKYKISDATGAIREIVIEGDSEADALNRLRRRGLTPLRYLGTTSGESQQASRFSLRKKFNVYDFTDRLAPLLKAHIPLERALEIIASGITESKEREIVISLRRGLHEGKKFSELIRNSEGGFPRLYANLVETGESTGCLPEIILELQRFMNESRGMKEFIISSSIYPLIILSVSFGVLILIFTVFIPRFSKVFIDMGKELPLSTTILMEIGNWVIALWWIWPLLIISAVILRQRIKHDTVMRYRWDGFVLKLPLLGSMIAATDMNRFIHTTAILLKNHVKLLDTVEIGQRIIQNSYIRKTFNGLNQELRNGVPLSDALKKSPYMPTDAVQMLKVGEESGAMGEMLGEASENLNNRMKVKVQRLLALFEPAIILMLASIITMVVLSIFMAIMEMNEL
ncbi:MAG: type II secretion system F family protein [Victivallaceae bacterium]|nr:type II secretion system F family protein [Victivallaceae bacterium]